MRDIFQNIVFFENEESQDCSELYVKGEKRIVVTDSEDKYLLLPSGSVTDFSTYFNSCSYRKWLKFTALRDLALKMLIQGKGYIKVVGYDLNGPNPQKTSLCKMRYDTSLPKEVEIEIPENDCCIVGFEIEAFTNTHLIYGGYAADFPSSKRIKLSLCTTTCRKEFFIKRNIRFIIEKLVDSKLLDKSLSIHVVDNGNTLKREDFPSNDNICLHPNHNTGGAGGFARGMIESLHESETPTHVLLMDDDVLVEPEAIFRTYQLLTHLLDEYSGRFISGAMLYMENPTYQKEDVGYVANNGCFYTWKREFDHTKMVDLLENERDLPFFDNSYSAWWYCCIPIQTIQKKGLPLPIFVRGDDIEYGIRCNPGFITMNSICVWHMGFTGKFNVVMDHYQVNRNLLIDGAVSHLFSNVNILLKIKRDFKHHIMRFDYNSAEIVLRALEDYLKGPQFIAKDIGEKVLKENNNLVHSYTALEELGNPDWGGKSPYEDEKLNLIRRIFFRLTWNGQVGWGPFYRKDIVSVPYNDVYLPEKISFRKKIIAINPFDRKGCFFIRDNKRARKLILKYYVLLLEYKKKKERLAQEYADYGTVFTSESFWRTYLEL